MDQPFKSSVTHDLIADSPAVSADGMFEDDSYCEGFEDDFEEGMGQDILMDDMNQYDEGAEDYDTEAYFGDDEFDAEFEDDFNDEFAEDSVNDAMSALELAVAEAMDADSNDEFMRRLISGVQRVAGKQGIRTGTTRTQERGLSGIIPILQQSAAHGADERELFDDMVDWFEQENTDQALAILGGVVARNALSHITQHSGTRAGRAVNRQIVRSATQAARNLINQQGSQAVRALQPIATSVGRVAARRGMKPAALPDAIRQAATAVASQPALTRRLMQTTLTVRTGNTKTTCRCGGSVPRRFVVNGTVDIIIRR